MNQQIHEEAAEWLVELRSRSDAATRARFDQWLAKSPEHVRAYLECAAVAETAAAAPRGAPADIQALIERARESAASNVVPLSAAIPGAAPSRPAIEDSSSEDPPRSFRRLRFAAAAAVLLAVIGATFGYFTTRNVYTTEVGEQRSILLSDGSTIDMNGRSKVRVRLGSNARSVDLLEGEALFRVAKDASRPFVVAANETRVRAVGTEFAINRRQRTLLVTVVEGTVAVSVPMRAPAPDEMLLNANQQVALSLISRMSALPEPRHVDVNDAIAWTKRRLVFDSTPLEDVVADFNRHSSRELVIQGSGLQDFHVSGAFSSTDVDPFLRFLRAQPGVEVIEEQDRIVIRQR